MTNSADPDQLDNCSESTLFAKTGRDVFSKRRVKTFQKLILLFQEIICFRWEQILSFKISINLGKSSRG